MLIAVLENPTFIVNIANAIRNVNGLGVDALFVIDGRRRLDDDPEMLKNRKSLIKHSSGAVRFTQVRRFDSSEACFDFLEQCGFVSVATSPDAGYETYPLTEAKFDAPKLAIWFGDEGNGLDVNTINRCDFCVCWPMAGEVESFSLGSFTGIVLYEAIRQRNCRLPNEK